MKNLIFPLFHTKTLMKGFELNFLLHFLPHSNLMKGWRFPKWVEIWIQFVLPFSQVYQIQTDFFNSVNFEFQGDASLWKTNNSDSSTNVIEFVTSPNNPDGQLKKAVLQGSSSVKAIHDHAYYWPHFTAIPAPADEDLMIFTMSKLTGHAGSRFG